MAMPQGVERWINFCAQLSKSIRKLHSGLITAVTIWNTYLRSAVCPRLLVHSVERQHTRQASRSQAEFRKSSFLNIFFLNLWWRSGVKLWCRSLVAFKPATLSTKSTLRLRCREEGFYSTNDSYVEGVIARRFSKMHCASEQRKCVS